MATARSTETLGTFAPRKVDIRTVICMACRLPATLDEDGKCEFCRRVVPLRERRVNEAQLLLVVVLIMAAVVAGAVLIGNYWWPR